VKILAGTVVKSIGAYDEQAGGANSSRVELIVDGGELRVEGDVNNPVVFTTTGVAGDWYGIRIVKQAAGISIRNCIIDKAINGLEVLSVQQDALPTIEALTVQNSANTGVYINVGKILSPDSLLMKNCLLKKNSTGLSVDNSQNVLFEGCEFSYNSGRGVSLGYSNNLNFKDCVFRGNGEGIGSNYTGNLVTLSNCTVEYNGGTGISIYGDINILNCTVSSNGDGVVIGGGKVTVVDSVLKDNRGFGLCITQGDTSMEGIKRNKITGNKRGIGFLWVANPFCRVEGNDIYGNEEYEAVNEGGSAIQTENTYWGEPTTSEIQQGKANLSKIFDKADDPNRGEIQILSYRTGPLTPNEPPTVPILSSPADGATVSTTPTFRIKATDPEGGQLKYAIQVFQNNQVVKIFDQRISPAGWSKTSYASGEIADFTVPIAQALSEGAYQWRALAFDQEGTQSASALHSFKVQATSQPPLKPLALTPSNNETVSGNPSFVFATYDPDNDNFWCILEIWQGDTRLRVYDQRQDATGWSKTTFSYEDTKYFNLPEGFALPAGNYKWRIKAIDSKGLESEWSEFANFVVDPALAPTPLVTFQLPVSLHIGQEDHSFVFFLNTTPQPWEGFSFIRLKLQSQQGVSKVAYRVWTVDKAGKEIILSNGETYDEISVPTEFIPPVEPGS
jgi:parallel beta-helix repeat protein